MIVFIIILFVLIICGQVWAIDTVYANTDWSTDLNIAALILYLSLGGFGLSASR